MAGEGGGGGRGCEAVREGTTNGDKTCILLSPLKFKLSNQDSEGGKIPAVLTSMYDKSWKEIVVRQNFSLKKALRILTGDGIAYPQKVIYNSKLPDHNERSKKYAYILYLHAFYLTLKNGSTPSGNSLFGRCSQIG